MTRERIYLLNDVIASAYDRIEKVELILGDLHSRRLAAVTALERKAGPGLGLFGLPDSTLTAEVERLHEELARLTIDSVRLRRYRERLKRIINLAYTEKKTLS